MNSLETTAVLINCAAAFALTGVTWLVQLVHYPLLAFVDRARFTEAHTMHTRRITPFVAPLMVIELAAASLLAVLLPKGVSAVSVYAGLVLVGVIWASTFAVQVPLHGRLSKGLDESEVRRLVATNWIRTVAWSARSLLSIYLLFSLQGPRL